MPETTQQMNCEAKIQRKPSCRIHAPPLCPYRLSDPAGPPRGSSMLLHNIEPHSLFIRNRCSSRNQREKGFAPRQNARRASPAAGRDTQRCPATPHFPPESDVPEENGSCTPTLWFSPRLQSSEDLCIRERLRSSHPHSSRRALPF